MFSYYASSYGDAICLPILIGSLIAYVYQAKEIRLSISRTEVFITIICCLVGAGIQLSWLMDDNIVNNWSIPEKYYFNPPGWSHAFFFTFILAILGFLLVRFIRIKRVETIERSKLEIICQMLIWLTGILFMYLHIMDDYISEDNYQLGFTYTLIGSFVVLGFIYYILIWKMDKNRISNQDVMVILSALFPRTQ